MKLGLHQKIHTEWFPYLWVILTDLYLLGYKGFSSENQRFSRVTAPVMSLVLQPYAFCPKIGKGLHPRQCEVVL